MVLAILANSSKQQLTISVDIELQMQRLLPATKEIKKQLLSFNIYILRFHDNLKRVSSTEKRIDREIRDESICFHPQIRYKTDYLQ